MATTTNMRHMLTTPAPQCPKSPLHDVHQLAGRPSEVLTIPNGQGPPTVRILEAEAPPWWCDRCGLQVAAE